MGKSKNQPTGGTSITIVLFIVFLVLKLIGVITWSWLWVLSPLWIPIALIVGIFIIIKFFASIFG